jgi:hypothetical protein
MNYLRKYSYGSSVLKLWLGPKNVYLVLVRILLIENWNELTCGLSAFAPRPVNADPDTAVGQLSDLNKQHNVSAACGEMLMKHIWSAERSYSPTSQAMELLPAALPSLKAPFSFPGLKNKIKYILYTSCFIEWNCKEKCLTVYRLCGLVAGVPGYRSRGLEFDSRRCQIFWEVVGLELGST